MVLEEEVLEVEEAVVAAADLLGGDLRVVKPEEVGSVEEQAQDHGLLGAQQATMLTEVESSTIITIAQITL